MGLEPLASGISICGEKIVQEMQEMRNEPLLPIDKTYRLEFI
jgi:hypothetical protein